MTGTVLIAALLALTLVLSQVNWRQGFLMLLVVGFLQDPARKLTAGEPVYFVVAVTAALAILFVVAYKRTGMLNLHRLLPQQRRLHSLLALFIGLVVLQSIHSLVTIGSPVITGMGLLFYVAPLPVLWLAFSYPRGTDDVRRFLRLYLGFVVVLAATVLLSWAGVESVIFKEIGEGLVIFDKYTGLMVDAHGGFMRTPEIASWHMGTGACLAITYAIAFGRRGRGLLWIALAALLLFCILLTGRRKMIIEIFGFLACLSALTFVYRAGSFSKAFFAMALLAATFFWLIPQLDDETSLIENTQRVESAEIGVYVSRGKSAFGETGERMTSMGLGSIVWAYDGAGFFGLGVGAGAQGAQHFGGAELSGAAEGGLGRVMGELGVPGLVLVLTILVLSGLYLFRLLASLQHFDRRLTRLTIGLYSLLLANFPVFVAASQVFGDPFILTVLACLTGFLLKIGWVVHRTRERARRPAAQSAALANSQ